MTCTAHACVRSLFKKRTTFPNLCLSLTLITAPPPLVHTCECVNFTKRSPVPALHRLLLLRECTAPTPPTSGTSRACWATASSNTARARASSPRLASRSANLIQAPQWVGRASAYLLDDGGAATQKMRGGRGGGRRKVYRTRKAFPKIIRNFKKKQRQKQIEIDGISRPDAICEGNCLRVQVDNSLVKDASAPVYFSELPLQMDVVFEHLLFAELAGVAQALPKQPPRSCQIPLPHLDVSMNGMDG